MQLMVPHQFGLELSMLQVGHRSAERQTQPQSCVGNAYIIHELLDSAACSVNGMLTAR